MPFCLVHCHIVVSVLLCVHHGVMRGRYVQRDRECGPFTFKVHTRETMHTCLSPAGLTSKEHRYLPVVLLFLAGLHMEHVFSFTG